METITAASTAKRRFRPECWTNIGPLLAQYGDLGRVRCTARFYALLFLCGEITQTYGAFRQEAESGNYAGCRDARADDARDKGADVWYRYPEALLQHHWQTDTVSVGRCRKSCAKLSAGRYAEPIRVEVSRRLMSGNTTDFSIGQVVPHEVVGMAITAKIFLSALAGGR